MPESWYLPIENRIVEILYRIDGYSDENVSAVDPRILITKGHRNFLMLEDTQILGRQASQSFAWKVTTFNTPLRLYTLFAPKSTIREMHLMVQEELDKVLRELDRYPDLAGLEGVTSFIPINVSQPAYWSGESRNWWVTRIFLQTTARHTSLDPVYSL